MHLYQWSCFFLLATSLICAVGLVSSFFDDNLFQCAGMVLLMIGCASRVNDIWLSEHVPIDWFLVHAGIGLFAIGVFAKFLKRYMKDRRFARGWAQGLQLSHLDRRHHPR